MGFSTFDRSADGSEGGVEQKLKLDSPNVMIVELNTAYFSAAVTRV